jgi:PIN domain nuclease of toxin-antitoxin system
MRILLDTHTVLWWAGDIERLSTKARTILSDVQSDIFMSVVTVWEIAIKYHLGRLRMPISPEQFIAHLTAELQLTILPIEASHTFTAASLPFHHRDPFDRLLVSHAMYHNIPILTSDSVLPRYPIQVIW